METEVVAKALRRRFTAAEKLRVLREAGRCRGAGEMGELLRREGLTSSHLSAWRAARRRGELAGSQSRARRPKPRPNRPDARDRRILELERENRRLKTSAQALVELQERVSRHLGIPLEREAKR